MEVDQAFPLLTTKERSRRRAVERAIEWTPTVTAVIRDVLGWRPRRQDTAAFTAALNASFELETVEGHIEARYVPSRLRRPGRPRRRDRRASLYTRAKTSHVEITRILDTKPPDRTPTRRATEGLPRPRARLGPAGGQRTGDARRPDGRAGRLRLLGPLTGKQFGPGLGATSVPSHRRPPYRLTSHFNCEAPGSATANRFGHLPVDLAPPGETADDIPRTAGSVA